jgi:hypothetical protein
LACRHFSQSDAWYLRLVSKIQFYDLLPWCEFVQW